MNHFLIDRLNIMNLNLLITFLVGMIILAATPGPGVFGSMAKAAAEGFKMSLFFIGGLVLGDIIFLSLALLGLSAVAKMLGHMFIVIKIAGGLYLVYLGVRIFRDSRISTNINTPQNGNRLQTSMSGLLLTLGNPKPVLFYASVLPTIINFDEVRFTDAVLMMMLIALVSFSVLGTYSYIASLSHNITMSETAQKRINRTAGLVMMTVGMYVIIT